MVALGSFQTNEYLKSFNRPSRALKSLVAVVLFLTLITFGPVPSNPCFGLPSMTSQNETHASDHETNDSKAILYFFTAHWCGPCHKVQPFVDLARAGLESHAFWRECVAYSLAAKPGC